MARTARGARVLITGATTGVGLLLAVRAVLERASTVVIWDRSPELIVSTVNALTSAAQRGTTVRGYPVDVRELGAIAQNAQKVRKHVGNLDILVNTAQLAGGKAFWETDNGEDVRPIMQVNALAPLYITREFLPAMIDAASRHARILNVASAAGLRADAGVSVYAAAQAAVIGWSDSLRRELDRRDHGNVKVTTAIARIADAEQDAHRAARAAIDPLAVTSQQVADRAWSGMLAGAARVTVPRSLAVARLVRGFRR